jgi:hypothetical protein
MNPLVRYYVNQVGRGGYAGIGPIYAVQPFVQRGHGLGNILGNIWRFVKPLLWSSAKTVGQESLRTGRRILSDTANKTPDVSAGDIISNHVSEATQKLVRKLRGGGGVSVAKETTKKRVLVAKRTKGEIFSLSLLVSI